MDKALNPVSAGERWLCAAVRQPELAGRAEDVPQHRQRAPPEALVVRHEGSLW